jgi:hypothetical protein
MLYYRLNVNFENGQHYFSNIVALRHSESNGRPALAGNMILETISVNTPLPYSYSILDYNGRLVAKGNLSQGMNRIDAARLGTGMYLIQYNNGQEQFSEKFMKH